MSRLYILATPIGNLEDVTLRALRILSEADYVFAEDTRVTQKLLKHYKLQVQMFSWHQHSADRDWQRAKKLFIESREIAYVTDAGTPGVSDPGGKLIEYVVRELPQVEIIPVPGASSLTAALSVAGIPMGEFLFIGFLPHKKGRQKKLLHIAESKIPVVIFESVHRVKKLLAELAGTQKEIIVFRELTKKFERIYRGSARTMLASIPESEIKGEFVIIVFNKKHD